MEYKLITEDVAQIAGFPYLINRDGRLWSMHRDRFLEPTLDSGGYLHTILCNNGKKKGVRIHRLVAEAFVDKPYPDLCVNHKDGNKTNNHYENLEWVTMGENVHHYHRELKPLSGAMNAPS